MAEVIYFPWRSIVGMKGENVRMHIKMEKKRREKKYRCKVRKGVRKKKTNTK